MNCNLVHEIFNVLDFKAKNIPNKNIYNMEAFQHKE